MTQAPPAAESAEPTAEEIFEQKAVRLAKRERLIADASNAAGGAYPVSVPVTTMARFRFMPVPPPMLRYRPVSC